MSRESRIDTRIICPFYMDTYRRVIFCAPVTDDALKTGLTFANMQARNEYIDNFCGSFCWRTCAIARQCMENESGGAS